MKKNLAIVSEVQFKEGGECDWWNNCSIKTLETIIPITIIYLIINNLPSLAQ